MNTMSVGALHCNHCKYIIFSRSRHDMHSCMCGETQKAVFVDGGRDYMKISYGTEANYKKITLNIPFSNFELYRDWDHHLDKLGTHQADEKLIRPRYIWVAYQKSLGKYIYRFYGSEKEAKLSGVKYIKVPFSYDYKDLDNKLKGKKK